MEEKDLMSTVDPSFGLTDESLTLIDFKLSDLIASSISHMLIYGSIDRIAINSQVR